MGKYKLIRGEKLNYAVWGIVLGLLLSICSVLFNGYLDILELAPEAINETTNIFIVYMAVCLIFMAMIFFIYRYTIEVAFDLFFEEK